MTEIDHTLRVRPISPALGAEIEGMDLRQPPWADKVRALRARWLKAGILLFRGQNLSPAQLLAFTRCIGSPTVYTRSENACRDHPEVLVLSNVIVDGRPLGAAVSGRYWHTDGHFLECPPAATLLFAHEVPPRDGDTWFVDMRRALQALPGDLRREIEGRRFLMDRAQSLPYHYPERPEPTPEQRALWSTTEQPVVRTHPETGEAALYIGGLVPWCMVGLERSSSDALMREVHAIAFQEQWCYRHKWRAGDLLIWDNRSLAHRATNYDSAQYRRTMYRTTTAGEKPFYRAPATEQAVAS